MKTKDTTTDLYIVTSVGLRVAFLNDRDGVYFSKGEIVEVQNTPRGVPTKIRSLGTPHWWESGKLREYIHRKSMVKISDGWSTCIVKESFFLDEEGYCKGEEVEIKGGLVNTAAYIVIRRARNHKPQVIKAATAYEHLEYVNHAEFLKDSRSESSQEIPDLSGTPLEIAIALLPRLREIFPQIPSYEWRIIISDDPESKKVSIIGHCDIIWSIFLFIGEEKTVAILCRDRHEDPEDSDFKEQLRDILDSRSWTDYLGWFSFVNSHMPNVTYPLHKTYLVLKPFELKENIWEVGEILQVKDKKIVPDVIELLKTGYIVLYKEHSLPFCGGCWHANNGCSDKSFDPDWEDRIECSKWTSTEPPPLPLFQTECPTCDNSVELTDHKGRKAPGCARRLSPMECKRNCPEYTCDTPF